MSFSGLIQQSIANVYMPLHHTIGTASLSTGIIDLASRTTTRVAFPNPLVVAKVTAAITLLRALSQTLPDSLPKIIEKASKSKYEFIKYSALASGIYGVNILLNPDDSYQAAAKLGALAYGSHELYKRVFASHVREFLENFHDHRTASSYDSFISTARWAVKDIYEELPQTLVATIATGLLSRSISFLGLNPKTAMTFTIATAALRGLNLFIGRYIKNVFPNNLTNVILMTGLSLGAKHYIHPDIPGFATLAKGYGIAFLAIEASARLIKRIR